MEYFGIFIAELLVLFFLSRMLTKSLFLLFHLLTHSKHLSLILFAILFYPGVILHELAHYIAALILLVPVGKMEFQPVLSGNSAKLGSVSVAKSDPIRYMLIGVAPIFAGTIVIITTLFFVTSSGFITSFWKGVVVIYSLFVVGNTMFSSKKDVEGTLELLLAAAAVGGVLYYLGVRIPIAWLFTNDVVQSIQKGNIYIAIPIIIDTIIIGVTTILTRALTRL